MNKMSKFKLISQDNLGLNKLIEKDRQTDRQIYNLFNKSKTDLIFTFIL